MKGNNGFSVVEILVAMVILSFVMLVATNMTIASTLEHGISRQKDDGYQFAREILTHLQDPTEPAESGSDSKSYKGITFTRSWTVDGSTSPAKAVVTVTWTQDGRTHTSEAIGYIDADNVCIPITNNSAPSGITLKLGDGSELATSDRVELSLNAPAGTFIATAVGTDANSSDGDILRISLLDGALDNDQFYLTTYGDTIKTVNAMDIENKLYNLKIQVEDCAGATFTREFQVHVGGPSQKPKVDSPQNLTAIDENSQGTGVATIQPAADHDYSAGAVTWSTSDPNFTINSSTGEVRVGSSANLNFESGSTYSFTVTASRNNEDSVIQVNVPINDVNEAPTSVSLSGSHTIAVDGDVVGTLSGSDPDEGSCNSEWYQLNFYVFGASNFTVDPVSKELKKKDNVTLSAGTEDVKIYAMDGESIESPVATFTITINSSGSETGGTMVNCSGVDPFLVYNGSNQHLYYGGFQGRTPDRVVFEGKLWEGHPDEYNWYNHNGLPGSFAKWVEVGVCQ